MVSGLVLKLLNRLRFVISRDYKIALPTSSKFNLTAPNLILQYMFHPVGQFRGKQAGASIGKMIIIGVK